MKNDGRGKARLAAVQDVELAGRNVYRDREPLQAGQKAGSLPGDDPKSALGE